jgi:hypothetical protein
MTISFSQEMQKQKETEEEMIIRLLTTVLQDLPERIKSLKPEIRRILFYSFHVDKSLIKPSLKRSLQATIESAFTKLPQVKLVNAPELKPLRIEIRDDSFKLGKGIKSMEEMKKISETYKIDGILEADLFLSKNNLYLNLNITELETGALVWTENFFSKEIILIPKEFATQVDISFGMTWIETSELQKALINPPKVLSFTPYYTIELEISEPSFPVKHIDFCLKGGLSLLAEGTSFGGGSYIKTGLRTGIIKKKDKEGRLMEGRYWLAIDADFGRIFTTEQGQTIFGIHIESNISQHFSFSAGFSYFTPIEATYSGSKIKIGGVSYEIFALRYHF